MATFTFSYARGLNQTAINSITKKENDEKKGHTQWGAEPQLSQWSTE